MSEYNLIDDEMLKELLKHLDRIITDDPKKNQEMSSMINGIFQFASDPSCTIQKLTRKMLFDFYSSDTAITVLEYLDDPKKNILFRAEYNELFQQVKMKKENPEQDHALPDGAPG